MLHNFGHSFCSGMNWINNGNELAIDELVGYIEKGRYTYIKINFSTGNLEPGIFSDQLIESVKRYQVWLPVLAKAHGVEIEKLKDVSFIIEKGKKGLIYFVSAHDDRSNNYNIRF